MTGVECTLYVADRIQNEFMSAFDLCPPYKVFAKTCVARFTTTTSVDHSYFQNLIEKSKEQKDAWIPAIVHNGVLYKDPAIREISDGQKIMFV
jgi:hypothetical protein